MKINEIVAHMVFYSLIPVTLKNKGFHPMALKKKINTRPFLLTSIYIFTQESHGKKIILDLLTVM